MKEIIKIGRMRNASEITYDFDKSSILKFTLKKSNLF